MDGGTGEELERVRELRERGLTPKEIARAVGLPPARVTHLVRKIAAAETVDSTQRPVVECWVSPGWSAGLTVTGHPEWPAEPAEEETSSGLVGVLVAREAGRSRSACVPGWSTSTASGSRTTWARRWSTGPRCRRPCTTFSPCSGSGRWRRRWSWRNTWCSELWSTPAAWASNPQPRL